MSTLTAHSPVKVWDNAAFDSEAPAAAGEKTNLPWLPLQPISLDPAKENRSPNSTNNKPLLPDIDSEIEELEREIARLSKKLHLLKIKKKSVPPPSPKRAATPFAKRGRVVPAKFMNAESATPLQQQKQKRAQQSPRTRGMSLGPMEIISRIPNVPASVTKKAQESPGSHRRGLSLGPMEISAGIATPLRSGLRKPLRPMLGGIKEEKDSSAASLRRRGMSIGPAEIFSASRSQFRQKGAKETRAPRSLSASPKPRRAAASSRVPAATVGAKRPVRREDGPVSNIKPKALFQEAKTPGKRPNAKVRIVASRYSLIGCKKRKWSLPEPGKEDRSGLVEEGGGGSSRSMSLGGPIARSSTTTEEEERTSSPASIMKMAAALPKIRTLRCGATESPRDSGCAKRVAELVGRRSCFAAADDGSGSSPCQSLNFDEEDQQGMESV